MTKLTVDNRWWRSVLIPTIFFLQGCFIPANTHSSNAANMLMPQIVIRKRSTQKRMVMPPAIITDAVFRYKKKYLEWPFPIEAAFMQKDEREQYKRLQDEGMDPLVIAYTSKDSLLIDFIYNLDKHARFTGSNQTYYPNYIKGQYVFVSDSSLTIFNILLGKDLKKTRGQRN